MRGSYWFGQDDCGEVGHQFYRLACKKGNLTACRAYERFRDRAPFIFGGKRLFVGAALAWGKHDAAKVTSFATDGLSLTACTYKPHVKDEYRSKIDKRFVVTLRALRAAERKNRAANEERQEVARLVRELERHNVDVEPATVSAWGKKQRKEALEWAKAAWQYPEPKRPAFLPRAPQE